MLETTDQLSRTFAALADPTRRAILVRLSQGEATVNELAQPFDLRLPTISKHLKVLQQAGLVTQSRQAQWRPCRLEAEPLREVAEWAERFRAGWEARFQDLDAYLEEMKSAPASSPKAPSSKSTKSNTRERKK